MKPIHLLFLLTFFSIISTTAEAQRGIRIGIRAGLNASNTSNGFGAGTSFKDPNYRIGSAFGLLLNIPIAGQLSLQPELNYSSEGSVQDGENIGAASGSYGQIFELKTKYLNIPFLVQYKGNAKGIFLEAGPQLGSLLQSKLFTKVVISGFPSQLDVKNTFNSTVISAVVGAGLNISKSIGFGVRYTFGLTNASDENPEIKNSAFNVGLHVKF